jgi:rod shape determining protein RodA
LKVEYKLQDKFDFWIFGALILLITIGLISIYSATVNHPTAYGNFQKQFFWVISSLTVFMIVYYLPQNLFRIIALPSYALSIILLTIVLFAGKTVYGAKSWLDFGGIGFQPSEFAKIGTMLALSYWLTYKKRDINNFKDISIALVIGFVPIFLILLEPDMGTAIVFMAITIVMIFWSGISLLSLFYFKKDIFTSITVFILNLASAFFFDFVFNLLKPHQQKRIESFLDPMADPLGSGYNALQAKVAIGSGGFLGKGFLQGNQTQLRFIPEQWTDFIYCVVGEEFGFIGSIFVIILFVVIFIRLLGLANSSKDEFSSLTTIGILAILFAHFMINIGMNVGITPVIGLPLPYVSYGGSSLLVNMILIGIAFNTYRNRRQHI